MKQPISLLLLVLSCLAISVDANSQKHPARLANVPETSAKSLHTELQQGEKPLIIDVRTPKEYASGHVPNAVNIPLDRLAAGIARMKLPKSTRIVTVCVHGGRSSRAVVMLRKLGYSSSSFCTLKGWQKEGYKIQRGKHRP